MSPHYSTLISQRRNSVHANTVDSINSSFIEYAIFGLFKIDVGNLIKIKVSLAKEFHIQPSEIDNMFFWEYELFMRELNAMVKEDNKRQENEMNKSNYKDAVKMPNYKSLESQYKSSMPSFSMPSMPKI